MTLDLSGLDYISSAGLGVLLKTQKRLMGTGGKLRLAGLKPHLRTPTAREALVLSQPPPG